MNLPKTKRRKRAGRFDPQVRVGAIHPFSSTSQNNDQNNNITASTNNNNYYNNNNDHTSVTNNNDNNNQHSLDTLQRLIAFAQPEHSWIGWSAATLLITSSTTLILPTASGQVLDLILSGDSSVSPTLVAGGLFGLTALAGTGVYWRTLWLQQAGNRLTARLKTRLYAAMLQQDMAFLDHQKTGDLLTRLSQDTTLIQSAVTTHAVAALRALVMSTGSCILLIQTSSTLAMVSLSTLPPLFLAARTMGYKLRDQQKQVQQMHSQATALAEEGLNGMATVKQFGAEMMELQRYETSVTSAHNQAIRTGKTQALLDGAVHIGANGAILCVLGFGGSMVLDGQITAGDLTGFLMYSLLLAGNVSSLSTTYAEVMKAVAAADRVWEIMERQPAIPSGFVENDEQDIMDGRDKDTYQHQQQHHHQQQQQQQYHHPLSVEFRNIQFAYPTRSNEVILGPHFSLAIQAGEHLSLVGRSGSGKSTLAALLTRLYDIDIPNDATNDDDDIHNDNNNVKPAIFIDGRDLRDWNPTELRQSVVGIVSQEPVLFDGSIADNIGYGKPSATDAEMEEAARLSHVLDFARQFPDGLDTKVGSRGTQLSGGQRQRVALARLMLKDPPIVVLDEATSALDAESEYLVKQAINSAMKGRTVISIAHRLSTIQGADRIAVLQEGQIVEVGTFQELSRKEGGAFQSLMGRQLTSVK